MNSQSSEMPMERPTLAEDLAEAAGTFPNHCLRYLKGNLHLLTRGVYRKDDLGCLFNLLSRPLEQEICTKEDLSEWFTGDRGAEMREASPLYQCARRVVHAWDERRLSRETITFVVDQLLRGNRPVGPMTSDSENTQSVGWESSSSSQNEEVQQELSLFC